MTSRAMGDEKETHMTKTVRKNGVNLIAIERKRQVSKEGYNADHDDEHDRGQLTLAAVCYAAPERVYVCDGRDENDPAASFVDPFPWDRDKRFVYGKDRARDGLPDPSTYTDDQRIDLLVKAGALIAAEIDRLLRKKTKAARRG